MELGLQRGTAKVLPHQPEWRAKAAETIGMLKALLGDTAVDIQHVGSTAIPAIHVIRPILPKGYQKRIPSAQKDPPLDGGSGGGPCSTH